MPFTIDNFSFDNLVFSDIKTNTKGGKTVYANLTDSTEPIYIRLPALKAPFGVSKYQTSDGPPKFSLDLSFRGHDSNPQIEKALKWFETFDEDFRQYVFREKRKDWLKNPDCSIELVRELCTSNVKYPIDKETGMRSEKYAPNIRLKLAQKGDGDFDCLLFGDKKVNGKFPAIPLTADTISNVIPKGATVEPIIRLTSLYFMSSKVGFSFKLVQAKVSSGGSNSGRCMFDDDEREKKSEEHLTECVFDDDNSITTPPAQEETVTEEAGVKGDKPPTQKGSLLDQ